MAERGLLARHNFRFSHALGQNFILDESMVARIVDAANVEKGGNVLEIGPGAGIMTRAMLEKGARVAAIEADEGLRGVLRETLGNADCVLFADALKADLDAFAKERFGGEVFRVVANLPYNIANDVLWRFLKMRSRPADICVMLQKEAAERICAKRGHKNYCAIAAACQYFARPEVLMRLPPEAFTPRPHVESTFLRLKMQKIEGAAKDDAAAIRLIQAAFALRRKTLCNNLTGEYGVPRERALLWLREAGLDERVRGEAVPLEGLARLSDVIADDQAGLYKPKQDHV